VKDANTDLRQHGFKMLMERYLMASLRVSFFASFFLFKERKKIARAMKGTGLRAAGGRAGREL
jgi:hypothetical protein